MKRCSWTICRLFFCALLGCCAGVAGLPAAETAQDKPKAPGAAGQPQDPMAEMMKLAKPGASHHKLQPLMGSFKTVSTSYMNPQGPEKTEGTLEATWVLGGRFLMSKYSGTSFGMPFEGLGILGYDNYAEKFVGSWMDTMGTSIMPYEGTIDAAGKVLTTVGSFDDPTTGAKMTFRMITTIVDQNKHTFEMFSTMGGQETKLMEATYTRK